MPPVAEGPDAMPRCPATPPSSASGAGLAPLPVGLVFGPLGWSLVGLVPGIAPPIGQSRPLLRVSASRFTACLTAGTKEVVRTQALDSSYRWIPIGIKRSDVDGILC